MNNNLINQFNLNSNSIRIQTEDEYKIVLDLDEDSSISLSDLNQFLLTNPISSESYKKLYKLAKQFADERKN
jgi:hypothetical protein